MKPTVAKQLTRVSRVREVESSNPKPAKSYTALQTARHRFIYASNWVSLALWRGDGHRQLVKRFGVIRRV